MIRETDVVLRLRWDDEKQDHPAGWDYRTLLWGDPFSTQGTYEVRLLAVEDVIEQSQEPTRETSSTGEPEKGD